MQATNQKHFRRIAPNALANPSTFNRLMEAIIGRGFNQTSNDWVFGSVRAHPHTAPERGRSLARSADARRKRSRFSNALLAIHPLRPGTGRAPLGAVCGYARRKIAQKESGGKHARSPNASRSARTPGSREAFGLRVSLAPLLGRVCTPRARLAGE